MKNTQDYFYLSGKQALENLKSRQTGLNQSERQSKFQKFGPNKLVKEKVNFWLLEFLGQFKNPLVIILILAATISIIFGETVDAAIILVIVLMSTLLNYLQEKKAGDAAKKLRERLKTQVTVICEGKKIETKLEDVYPGDLVFLNAGDLVPADGRILEAKDFFVNQSALTGESFPVEKTSMPLEKGEIGLSEMHNMVFGGTNVETGTATVLIVQTGAKTEFGKIAHFLNQAEDETEFTKGINQFSMLIMKLTIVIVLAVFFFNVLLRKDLLDSFLFAIAVAVGLTPELLPMILSVNMSKGSMKMAEKGVIVKKLVAIPNFGSMDILCTDKTGTLTQDKIALVKYVNCSGQDSEEVLRFAYFNSALQTGISNPMDEAVKKFRSFSTKDSKKIDEIPFDFLRKRMSVVMEEQAVRWLICKGAPEEVLEKCSKIGAKDSPENLTVKKHDIAWQTYLKLSEEGYRVLALATKIVDQERKVYAISDENQLTLMGFIAFMDPPKTDAKEVVKNLAAAGVSIKIITGDNDLVTRKICRDLDIEITGVIQGKQIKGMTDDALRIAVEKNNIFARFSPSEKNRIINALKQNGHVVGYMGDGINDAPSLRSADVGISVENAVDVAKESADLILTSKNLEALLNGILEGRKSFANSIKYIMMGVSSNFGNMFSIIGAVILLPFLPMLPIQILLNNLLYDFSQITIPGDNVDDSEISRPRRWDMKFVKKFMFVFGLISSAFDYLTFYLLLVVFQANAAVFQTGWFIESLATQTLIIHVIRTKKIPFIGSRASLGLTISTLSIVLIGWIIPFTPVANYFGFSPLPWYIALTLAGVVLVYLCVVEVAKRIFYAKVNSTRLSTDIFSTK